jgi:hypothetical protein
VKTRFTFLLLSVLLTASYVYGQQQVVAECSKRPLKDSVLREAIEQVTASRPAIEFVTEASPCVHARQIANALDRTIDKRAFSLVPSHSFSLIKNEGHFFSVERFVFKSGKTAALVGKSLKNRSVHTLQVESFTLYDCIVIGNNVILFIADRDSYHFNQALFNEIKDKFQEVYQRPKTSLQSLNAGIRINRDNLVLFQDQDLKTSCHSGG